MKTKYFAIATAVVALSGVSQSSFAQGMYGLVAIGSSMPTSSVKSDADASMKAAGATNLNTSMSNGTAMKLQAGYNVNPNFAVEGGYFDSGTMTYSGTATGATISADIRATGLQIALLGIAPINDKFSIFAKAGYTAVTVKTTAKVNTATSSSSTDKNNSGFGLGVTYKISDNLGVRAEWESVASDVNALTFGLQFKF